MFILNNKSCETKLDIQLILYAINFKLQCYKMNHSRINENPHKQLHIINTYL